MPACPPVVEPKGPRIGRGADDGRAGLYIHWPFCASKCPYCDFNSHVRESVDQERWASALVREIEYHGQRHRHAALSVESVFFGGGTPSLMDPDTVSAVLEAIGAWFALEPEAEVTLEANPTSVEAERFAGFRAAGVNRLSIGVQSLRDAALRFLGRTHSAAAGRKAVETARAVFDRVSIDLIYARPGQTAEDWSDELEEALALGCDHLSAYQLTIEPGTRFDREARAGRLTPTDDDRAATLFERTQDICEAAGLPAYEISNHARTGAECRHNLIYWQGRPYLGIGPGAHGRLPGGADGPMTAQVNFRSPEKWLGAVEQRGTGLESNEVVAAPARAVEIVMMGLRLVAGLDLALLERQTGLDWDHVLSASALDRLTDLGLVAMDDRRLVVLPAGRLLLDSILDALLA